MRILRLLLFFLPFFEKRFEKRKIKSRIAWRGYYRRHYEFMDGTIGCNNIRCISPKTVSGLHPLVYFAKTNSWDIFRIVLPKTGGCCTEKKETKNACSHQKINVLQVVNDIRLFVF